MPSQIWCPRGESCTKPSNCLKILKKDSEKRKQSAYALCFLLHVLRGEQDGRGRGHRKAGERGRGRAEVF